MKLSTSAVTVGGKAKLTLKGIASVEDYEVSKRKIITWDRKKGTITGKKLGKVKDKVWEPNQDNVEIYNELYEEYKTLHTYFGTGINDVMKHLNNIRERRK